MRRRDRQQGTPPISRLALLLLGVVLLGLGLALAPAPVTAGLPGYVEWVLWKEVRTPNSTSPDGSEVTLEWIVGPYPKLSDCEQDRDGLAALTAARGRRPDVAPIPAGSAVVVTGASDTSAIRLFCVPDSVNPRVDRRWP